MTDDTQDIVARLRRHRYNTWKDDLGPDPEKAEAANLIEEQAAALDMAMAEIEHLHWLLALMAVGQKKGPGDEAEASRPPMF